MSAVVQAMPTTQYNPYLEDTTSITNNNSAYYQSQTTYNAPAQPVSVINPYQLNHLILLAPISPLRSNWPSQIRPSSLPEINT